PCGVAPLSRRYGSRSPSRSDVPALRPGARLGLGDPGVSECDPFLQQSCVAFSVNSMSINSSSFPRKNQQILLTLKASHVILRFDDASWRPLTKTPPARESHRESEDNRGLKQQEMVERHEMLKLSTERSLAPP